MDSRFGRIRRTCLPTGLGGRCDIRTQRGSWGSAHTALIVKPTSVIRPSEAPIQVKVAVVLAALTSLGIAFYGEPLLSLTIPVLVAYFTSIAATVIAIATVIRASPNRLQQGRHSLLALLVGVTALFVMQFAAFPIAMVVQDHDLARTREWCDHLVSELERWRSEHGSYPESLEDTALVVDPPSRWSNSGRYRFRDGEFELSYSAGGIDFEHRYHSLGKSWR